MIHISQRSSYIMRKSRYSMQLWRTLRSTDWV